MDPQSPIPPDPRDLESVSESTLAPAEVLPPAIGEPEVLEKELAPPPATHRQLPSGDGPDRGRNWGTTLIVGGSKLVIVLALAWGLLFNFSEVRGSSMEPGIHDRDRILVDQVSYLFGEVGRGDVVVLRYPLDPSLDYIKRVVGIPGDEVLIDRGRVYINGEELTEPYVSEGSIDPWTSMKTTVRPQHYFVMGDNRRRSSDSREFGQVPLEYLRGKVRLRLYPLARFGWIQ